MADQVKQLDPNAPWSPEELAEELNVDELNEIAQNMPLLEEVINWYDEQIAKYGNPEIIAGVNPSSKAEDVKEAVLLAQGFVKGYKEKRNEFAKRFKKYQEAVKPAQG